MRLEDNRNLSRFVGVPLQSKPEGVLVLLYRCSSLGMPFNGRFKDTYVLCAGCVTKALKKFTLRMLGDKSTKEIRPVYARHLAMPDGPIENAVCVMSFSLIVCLCSSGLAFPFLQPPGYEESNRLGRNEW